MLSIAELGVVAVLVVFGRVTKGAYTICVKKNSGAQGVSNFWLRVN